MSERYDLIVVGGGIAGSSLAGRVASTGARVLVLERETQFRDRVRGEWVAPWGVLELERLGILDVLRQRADAHELTHQSTGVYRIAKPTDLVERYDPHRPAVTWRCSRTVTFSGCLPPDGSVCRRPTASFSCSVPRRSACSASNTTIT